MGGGGGAGLRGSGRGGRGRLQRWCPGTAGCAAGRRSVARRIPRPALERGRRADRQPAPSHRCSTRGRPAPQLPLFARSCVFSSRRARPWHERTFSWRSNWSPNTPVASKRGGWRKKEKRCASRPWWVLAVAERRAAQPPISRRISRAAHFCRPSASCSIRCLDAGSVIGEVVSRRPVLVGSDDDVPWNDRLGCFANVRDARIRGRSRCEWMSGGGGVSEHRGAPAWLRSVSVRCRPAGRRADRPEGDEFRRSDKVER